MATVLIADDQTLVRIGVRRLLEDLEHTVVGEAASGEEAVELACQHRPEIAFVDVHMPGAGGLEATQRIRRHVKGCRIIILTAHLEGPMPRTLVELGVDGFLTKGCTVDEMGAAISHVLGGKRYLGREVAQKLALAAVGGEKQSPFDRLTAREFQVVLMLLDGATNRAISETLNLSPKTITTYRQRILRKTGTRTLSDLLRLAIQYELITPGREPAIDE